MSGVSTETIKHLFAEFPKEDIHWRAQSVTRDGSSAMALAYIDARDVMDRLDDVCGVEGWQCRYSHAEGKTICEIGIKVDGEWLWKADGAGDTQVEAEKGATSDAFKRAAVRWGIGRYLYALPAPWVPCESRESKGKLYWKAWKDDPWNYIKSAKPTQSKAAARETYTRLVDEMGKIETVDALGKWLTSNSAKALYNQLPADWKNNFNGEVQAQKAALANAKVVNA